MSIPAAALPRVSVLLFAFRQEQYIREAMESLLAQTYANLEIIVSDDASPDGTWAVIEAVAREYHGPHTLVLNRNPTNLGISAHVAKLVEMASGELLIPAAGDDVSLPQRVERTVQAWLTSDGTADLIACNLYDMGLDGFIHREIHVDDLSRWRSLADWQRRPPYVVGAGHAWHRRLFEKFGPLPALGAEDQIMTFRAVAQGRAITIAEALVKYRRGGVSGRVRIFHAHELVARWRRGNPHSLAEMQQIIADAHRLGVGDEVARHLAANLAKERYIQTLLSTHSASRRWGVFWRACAVPWPARWRVFMYTDFPWLLAPIFAGKRLFARLRNKG